MSVFSNTYRILIVGRTGAGKTILPCGLLKQNENDEYEFSPDEKSKQHLNDVVTQLENSKPDPTSGDDNTRISFNVKNKDHKSVCRLETYDYMGEKVENLENGAKFMSDFKPSVDGVIFLINCSRTTDEIEKDQDIFTSFTSELSRLKIPCTVVATADDCLNHGHAKIDKAISDAMISCKKKAIDNSLLWCGVRSTDCAKCENKGAGCKQCDSIDGFKVTVTGEVASNDHLAHKPQNVHAPFEAVQKKCMEQRKKKQLYISLLLAFGFIVLCAFMFFAYTQHADRELLSSMENYYSQVSKEIEKLKTSADCDSLEKEVRSKFSSFEQKISFANGKEKISNRKDRILENIKSRKEDIQGKIKIRGILGSDIERLATMCDKENITDVLKETERLLKKWDGDITDDQKTKIAKIIVPKLRQFLINFPDKLVNEKADDPEKVIDADAQKELKYVWDWLRDSDNGNFVKRAGVEGKQCADFGEYIGYDAWYSEKHTPSLNWDDKSCMQEDGERKDELDYFTVNVVLKRRGVISNDHYLLFFSPRWGIYFWQNKKKKNICDFKKTKSIGEEWQIEDSFIKGKFKFTFKIREFGTSYFQLLKKAKLITGQE